MHFLIVLLQNILCLTFRRSSFAVSAQDSTFSGLSLSFEFCKLTDKVDRNNSEKILSLSSLVYCIS